MNLDVIKELGIESEDYQEILKALEEMQDDLLEQIEYVEDDERTEIEAKLDKIKVQADMIKKTLKEEAEKAAPSEEEERETSRKSVLIAEDEQPQKKNIPIAVSQKELEAEAKAKASKDSKKEEKLKENHEKELRAQADKLKKESLKNKENNKDLFNKFAGTGNNNSVGNNSGTGAGKVAGGTNNTAGSTGTGTNNGAGNNTGTGSGGTNGASADITNGLMAYTKKDYGTAFSVLSKAINDSANASDPGLPFAEYLMGHMFAHGEGTAKDDERASFWYEKAAEAKEPHACVEMGTRWAGKTPQNVADDNKIIHNSLNYFETAVKVSSNDSKLADIYKNAMHLYVTVCEKKNPNSSQIRKAYGYLDKLVELESDAYLKDQIRKRKEALKTDYKKKHRIAKSSEAAFEGWNDIVILASKFLFIIGAVLISYSLLRHAGEYVPDSIWAFSWLGEKYSFSKDSIIIWYPKLLNDIKENGVFYRAFRYEGMYGVSFLCLGSFIRSFGNRDDQGRITRVVSTVLSFVPLVIMGMGLITLVFDSGAAIASVVEGGELVGAMALTVAGMCAAYIPGKIVRYFTIY